MWLCLILVQRLSRFSWRRPVAHPSDLVLRQSHRSRKNPTLETLARFEYRNIKDPAGFGGSWQSSWGISSTMAAKFNSIQWTKSTKAATVNCKSIWYMSALRSIEYALLFEKAWSRMCDFAAYESACMSSHHLSLRIHVESALACQTASGMQFAIHDFEIRYEDESSGICGPYRILGHLPKETTDFASHPCILCYLPVARRCYNAWLPCPSPNASGSCRELYCCVWYCF